MAGTIGRAAAEELIEALYRTLLGRAPDRYGFQHHISGIVDLGGPIQETIETFLRSDEFASKHPSFVARYIGNDARRFTNDASQYGETGILIKLMVNQSVRHRVIVDVGARGREGSNSLDLLKHFGWTGLLVEANPDLIPQICHEFAGLNVAVLNLAVSDRSGTATFYLGENPDVSSLTKQFVENWSPCSGAVEVKVRRLGEILDEHAIPRDFDVLSLDVEGEDIKVLNDLMLYTEYRPRWIIIEASHNFTVRTLGDLNLCPVVERNYAIMGQTSANLLLGYRAS